MKRYGVDRVRRVWNSGHGIVHLFRVAVIGGDQRDAMRFAHAFRNPAEAGVDILARLDRLIEFPGVTNHAGLAKFTTNTSVSPSSTARRTLSVTLKADISGWRSYVAIFGDGTSNRFSHSCSFSTPPLKKYVMCAYFSVSASRKFCTQTLAQTSASTL